MIPINEQETVIQFNRDSKICTIWTSDSTMMTKLDKRCKSSPEYYKMTEETHTQEGDTAGRFYELSDKSLLSLRSTKVSRVLTEEQKKEMGERLRNMRKKSDSLQSAMDELEEDIEDEEFITE